MKWIAKAPQRPHPIRWALWRRASLARKTNLVVGLVCGLVRAGVPATAVPPAV